MTRDERDHLRGIVALWLTNGNKPVDGGNDTRYFAFKGGWVEAFEATQTLLQLGYVENGGGPLDEDDYITAHDLDVWPTALGIFEAFG